MEVLQFIFSSFWIWLGAMILIGVPLKFIYKSWTSLLRHLAIRKHGYPSNCDANGEFLNTEND